MMNLKDYIVKKEFLSHNSKRCYKVGEVYNGGKSFHTQMLLKHGFIEEPNNHKSSTVKPALMLLSFLMFALSEEGGDGHKK